MQHRGGARRDFVLRVGEKRQGAYVKGRQGLGGRGCDFGRDARGRKKPRVAHARKRRGLRRNGAHRLVRIPALPHKNARHRQERHAQMAAAFRTGAAALREGSAGVFGVPDRAFDPAGGDLQREIHRDRDRARAAARGHGGAGGAGRA